MNTFSAEFVRTVKNLLPAKEGQIPLHEPEFSGNEWKYVKDCLDTGWVSSVGSYVDRFEKDLAEISGVKRAVAVVNGTAGLHVALLASGVKPGDEVLVPALTFVATANAVAQCGAVPNFVDVEERSLGVDSGKLRAYLKNGFKKDSRGLINGRTGRRVGALIVMHCFGHPAELDPLLEVTGEFGLPLVEDAAEAIGSAYRGKPVGGFGRAAVLSFNGNKVVTTGGGGAVLTDDESMADHLKHLTTTAKRKHPWEFVHDEIAFNYRLPNINAALGCAQLERLGSFLERKRLLAEKYREALAAVKGVEFLWEPEGSRSNFWLSTALLDRENAGCKGEILAEAHKAGLGLRPAWELMHRLPMYAGSPRDSLEQAEDLSSRLINLPSSPGLVPGPTHGMRG